MPAGKDERRFAVLDVDPRCAQQHEYFAEMDAELKNGGYEHLLADLLRFDLSKINSRQVPRTLALLEQKIQSLDSVESWWLGRLMAGATTRKSNRWQTEIATAALFQDYIATCEQIGIKRKQDDTSFGIKLKKLMPGQLDKKRATVEVEDDRGVPRRERVYCYFLPSLSVARGLFEKSVNQRVSWPADEPDGADSSTGESDDVDF